ncbi:SRPBCC family protein [Mucilaginibacter sp. FT3.2]|uniref:SRPBCC family protein n=1 Tax=Mucilaginibacter sp. FT3.2 TaxID=2723090 RepID=UPI00161D97B2|nr:SRPBCC domain-containing protein [Mucilaginibacter sp. FT3.2]MBB6235038.1 uncharacterized protein YndB with AHSA1/START domain [Mucilaginibacter sp. FT3.2]
MMTFEKDLAKKQLHVVREFKAPVEKVWRAWTEAELLDKWWGPKPWNTVTKTMDFKPGGQWLYSMVGPNGEAHWSNVRFTAVGTHTFETICNFSDENGVPTPGFAPSQWHVAMKQEGDKTIVNVTLTFESETDLEKLVAMGFQGGFTMGLNQLEELLG